jgi:hypothetical protein
VPEDALVSKEAGRETGAETAAFRGDRKIAAGAGKTTQVVGAGLKPGRKTSVEPGVFGGERKSAAIDRR